jgi:hypothetical protein
MALKDRLLNKGSDFNKKLNPVAPGQQYNGPTGPLSDPNRARPKTINNTFRKGEYEDVLDPNIVSRSTDKTF